LLLEKRTPSPPALACLNSNQSLCNRTSSGKPSATVPAGRFAPSGVVRIVIAPERCHSGYWANVLLTAQARAAKRVTAELSFVTRCLRPDGARTGSWRMVSGSVHETYNARTAPSLTRLAGSSWTLLPDCHDGLDAPLHQQQEHRTGRCGQQSSILHPADNLPEFGVSLDDLIAINSRDHGAKL